MNSIIACTSGRRAILFGLAVVLLARVAVLSGEPHSTPAYGQVSDSSVLYYEVETPNYQIDASGVQVPGYARNDMPGAPALPVWSILVDLPPAGAWEISHQSLGERLLDQVAVVPAVPVPNLELASTAGWKAADLPDSVPVVDRPDLSIYGVNAFYPTSPVVAGDVQWQGGRRLLPLRVFPFQYNPVTHRLRYHPDLRVTVQISPRGPLDSQAVRDERPGEPAGSGLDARARDVATHAAGVNAAATSAGALRIRTGVRGLYRLTYGDLVTAGVPLGSVDADSFSMSYLGQPIDIEVTGDGDHEFESGELVIFYAEPYHGRYEASNLYWFTYGGAGGSRIASRLVTPTGTEPLVTTITQTLHIEFDREYRSSFPRPQDADHWFDTPLSPDGATGVLTATRTYDLPLDDALTSGNLLVRAALHGGADRPASPDKSIAIRLNDHAAGTFQWEGLAYYTATTNVPAAWLDMTPNRISLVAAISQLPGIDFYSVSPDWVEVTYPAFAEAEADRIFIESVVDGAKDVAVAGFGTPQVQVYDVRNPWKPVRLSATQAVPVGDTYTLHFWDLALPAPTYFLSSEAALSAPLAIVPDLISSWRTPDHEADYIAIVHSSLSNAIQPLLDYRTAEGMRVAKVDVQDIYDEWSFGLRDPEAIRSFLSYAYHHWNGTGPRPRYVLLVGDGHYDFTGVSGTSLPNLIPPYLVNVDPWLGETASDNRLVSVDGANDYLPDMAIGRIPATSPGDVTAVVNKIIAYETAAPDGDWQRRVVFVADNNLDPAGNFHAFSDDVRLNWLPSAYDDRTIYFNRDYFTGRDMQLAIRAAFNSGSLLLQWFGHGSIFRWGSVTMFGIFDPAVLAANDTWPFTQSYTCWTGYFINLAYGYQSLAEGLLLTPQRGSVADLSPSGLHVGDSLLVLNQGLTQAVFRQRIERVGDAVDSAKLYYFGHTGSFQDVIDTMVLFGDPALKLRLPPIDLSTSTMVSSPAQAAPGDTLHYTVTLQNTASFTATDVTVAVDYADSLGQVVGSTPPAVDANGILTWTLPTVPPGATSLTFDLQLAPVFPAGMTAIHAPTAVRSWGQALADLDAVSQVSAAPDLATSRLDASRAWAPPGYALSYTLVLSNTGNAPSTATWLTATLPSDLISVTSTSLVYDPPARQLTWQGAVQVGQPIALTFTGVVTPARTACGQLDVPAVVRDELGQVTGMSAGVNIAVPDVDCDGAVDIADVQQVAAHWGAIAGGPGYDPRYDLDADDAISVADIIAVALRWR